MKKFRLLLCLAAVAAVAATCCVSCTPEEENFDRIDLVGKWVRTSNGITGTEYWRYRADSTGITWDTGDDVSEAEGQAFTWTLDGNQLTQIHQFESSGAVVPKTYTVTTLTSLQLVYKDNYGQTFEFAKAN